MEAGDYEVLNSSPTSFFVAYTNVGQNATRRSGQRQLLGLVTLSGVLELV